MANYIEDTEFIKEIDELEALHRRDNLSLGERCKRVDEIASKYVLEFSRWFDAKVDEALSEGRSRDSVPFPHKDYRSIYRLSNILLDDDIRDQSPDKGMVDYPFLTETQLRRRVYGIHTRSSGNNFREISLKAANTYGTDGSNHRYPYRTFKSIKTMTNEAMKGESCGKVRTYQIRQKDD